MGIADGENGAFYCLASLPFFSYGKSHKTTAYFKKIRKKKGWISSRAISLNSIYRDSPMIFSRFQEQRENEGLPLSWNLKTDEQMDKAFSESIKGSEENKVEHRE